MTNEFEALKRLRQETCPATYMPDFDKEECCDVIEKALLELKAIKEAKPNEALSFLEEIKNYFPFVDLGKGKEYVCEKELNTIKQALLKQLSGSQYTNIFIDEAVEPNEAMECWKWLDATIPQWVREKDKEHPNILEPIKATLLKAEKLEKAIKCIENLNAYNIELKDHVFVNKLIYWKDDLMLTGYSDKSQFKVEDYGITWKEVEDNE